MTCQLFLKEKSVEGTVTVTPAGEATIHTYTAPETGWRVNSHIIELPSQLVLFDAQLTPGYAREVLKIADGLGKPLTRLYISHAHPDHFVGASLVEAPSYALAPVKELIDGSGDVRIERGYQNTPGHGSEGPVSARPVDHVVEPGQEVIDGTVFSFEAVADAETTEQLMIGLPDAGILITQDVAYNRVHLFIGEHAFDAWGAAITALEATAYEVILPGHGLPGDRRIYAAGHRYLAIARDALAAATGPDDLNRRLEAASRSTGAPPCRGCRTSTCSRTSGSSQETGRWMPCSHRY
jgi:glyoxylase-like metal-dependent hydrolase (beta-lactamase superfamily II)